jgi:hypothetical protein
MTPHRPSDREVRGWLHTLGVTSLCQWEVLVFCYHHQATLLTVADFARLLGQASNAIITALDTLEAQALLVRSRVSQGARLYQCSVALDSPHGAALARLLTLANDPAGLACIVQQLRQGSPPAEAGPQAVRRQADADAARRNRWLKAL